MILRRQSIDFRTSKKYKEISYSFYIIDCFKFKLIDFKTNFWILEWSHNLTKVQKLHHVDSLHYCQENRKYQLVVSNNIFYIYLLTHGVVIIVLCLFFLIESVQKPRTKWHLSFSCVCRTGFPAECQRSVSSRKEGVLLSLFYSIEKFITHIIVSEAHVVSISELVSMLEHTPWPMIACKSFSYLSKYVRVVIFFQTNRGNYCFEDSYSLVRACLLYQ